MLSSANILPVPNSRPNSLNNSWSMKYAKNTKTSPISAATIVFLAPSTFVLSPPEVIHLMPPYIRKARAITTVTIKTIFKIFPSKFSERNLLQRGLKLNTPVADGSVGHRLPENVTPNAGNADARYAAAGIERAAIFFIS